MIARRDLLQQFPAIRLTDPSFIPNELACLSNNQVSGMSGSDPHAGRPATNSAGNSLLSSNATSGYFLGRRPRTWESTVPGTNTTSATPSATISSPLRQPRNSAANSTAVETVRSDAGETLNTVGTLSRPAELSPSIEAPNPANPIPVESNASIPKNSNVRSRDANTGGVNQDAHQKNSQVEVLVSSAPASTSLKPRAIPVSLPSVPQRDASDDLAIVTQPQQPHHRTSSLLSGRQVVPVYSNNVSLVNNGGASNNSLPRVNTQNWSSPVSGGQPQNASVAIPSAIPTYSSFGPAANHSPLYTSRQDNNSPVLQHQPQIILNAPLRPAYAISPATTQQATRISSSNQTQSRPTLLEQCARIFEDKITQLATRLPITGCEQARIGTILDAVKMGDIFYPLVHQLSCIKTTMPEFLKIHLMFLPHHIEGLQVLEVIIHPNEQISPELLAVFSRFYEPLAIFSPGSTHQNWMNSVKHFLHGFAYRYEMLRKTVFTRGSPPSVRELHATFGLYQTHLSHIIFTDLLYQLFPNSHSTLGVQAITLFRMGQAHMSQSISTGIFGTPRDTSLQNEMHSFASQFFNLVRSFGLRPAKTYKPLRQVLGYEPVQPASAANTGPQASNVPRSVHANLERPSSEIQMNRQQSSTSNTMRVASAQNANPSPQRKVPDSAFFPRENQQVAISAVPDPNRQALHQADLSFRTREKGGGQDNKQVDDKRFYSFSDRVLDEPILINKDTGFRSWHVNIENSVYENRASVSHPAKDDPLGEPTRMILNNNVMVHLRCIEATAQMLAGNEKNFSAAATSWPEHIFISINGSHLDFQRKATHGRDIALDITEMLQQGVNEFKMSYHTAKKELGKSFLLTCELIRITDHSSALEAVGVLDAETSISGITRSLEKNGDNDEDLIMADAYLSIDLVDPITARIPDRPVRGQACQHRECFDLEPFLLSRPRRYKDCLVYPDEWRCPICRRDARPTSLVIDQFMVGVKEKLIAQNKSDTRAILVKEDGSWEAKTETVGQGNSHADQNRQRSISTRHSSVNGQSEENGQDAQKSNTPAGTEPEIIILDDDE